MSIKAFLLAVALSGCVPPHAPFTPANRPLADDGYGRALRGVVVAGYEVDTTDPTAGVITTKWRDQHVLMYIWNRYRWTLIVNGGALTVTSQCETQERDGARISAWTPCHKQNADRNVQAQALADAVVQQAANAPKPPAPAVAPAP